MPPAEDCVHLRAVGTFHLQTVFAFDGVGNQPWEPEDRLALGHIHLEFDLCLQACSESQICFSSVNQPNFYKSNKVLSDEFLCSQNSSNCNLAITQFNAIILHRMTLGLRIGRVTEKIRARTHCARSVHASNTKNRRGKHLVSLICF